MMRIFTTLSLMLLPALPVVYRAGAQDLPLADAVVDGAKVGFKIPNVPGDPTFDGTLSEDGNVISGAYTQGGATLEFKLTRTQGGS
jgi:hypothetical protein